MKRETSGEFAQVSQEGTDGDAFLSSIASAKKGGVVLQLAGSRISNEGFFVAPITDDMTVSKEEIIGQ